MVVAPKKKNHESYPERHGLRESQPDHCRTFTPLSEMKEIMERDCNARLKKADHAPMIEEELIAGRLYTGPVRETRSEPCRSPAALPPLAPRVCTRVPPRQWIGEPTPDTRARQATPTSAAPLD